MRLRAVFACLITVAVLSACQSQSTTPTALPATVPAEVSPNVPPVIAVQAAYRASDPQSRRGAVLQAVSRFVADVAEQGLSDEDASLRLTEAAFSSQQVKLTDPAFVRREGSLAVVGLPDGLGLYFFDEAGKAIEISRWTVGLSSVNAVWRDAETGIFYETAGIDDVNTVHFALLVDEEEWHVAWLSDDAPDWWFNARNASLDIQPDLSSIAVTGEAEKTTVTFNESDGAPQRTFTLIWERDLNLYQLRAPISAYDTRDTWLWSVAVPSPYATLVEFIQRLQRNQLQQAEVLIVNSEVFDDALAFGFQLISSSYTVILSEPDRLIIQGHQGTFEITFQQSDGAWKITGIAPTGIPEP
jgi:hypothetical protein